MLLSVSTLAFIEGEQFQPFVWRHPPPTSSCSIVKLLPFSSFPFFLIWTLLAQMICCSLSDFVLFELANERIQKETVDETKSINKNNFALFKFRSSLLWLSSSAFRSFSRRRQREKVFIGIKVTTMAKQKRRALNCIRIIVVFVNRRNSLKLSTLCRKAFDIVDNACWVRWTCSMKIHLIEWGVVQLPASYYWTFKTEVYCCWVSRLLTRLWLEIDDSHK